MKQKIMYFISLMILCLVTNACNSVPPLPALPQDAKILAFGDSLTFGTGANENESYPAVLSRIIGRKIINSGVPGEISAAGLQRLPEALEMEKPDIIILCHGGNDLLGAKDKQELANNLRAMIRMAHNRGVGVILVAVPAPDLTLKPPNLYEAISKEFHIPLEQKILPHILGKGSLKSDHIHPNAAGYKMFAEALAELLKKSGALPK